MLELPPLRRSRTTPLCGNVRVSGATGAIEQATRVLAKDLGARGITVNAVALGATDTVMLRKALTRSANPNLAADMASPHPQKRVARVDEIAPIVAFLAGEEARWVHGQVIHVSGGYVVYLFMSI